MPVYVAASIEPPHARIVRVVPFAFSWTLQTNGALPSVPVSDPARGPAALKVKLTSVPATVAPVETSESCAAVPLAAPADTASVRETGLTDVGENTNPP